MIKGRGLAILVLLLGWGVVRTGMTMANYNPAAYPTGSGELLQAYEEARQLKETGTLAFENIYVFHPPLYYVLLWPFISMGAQATSDFFYLLQILLFPLAIFFMAASAVKMPKDFPLVLLLATVVCLNFKPLHETFVLHKVEGIEFFLMCGAILAFRKRWDLLTGALVCLAANLKYLPGILVFFFLVKRERRVLLGVVLFQIALVLALGWALGATGLIDFVRHAVELLLSSTPESNHPIINMEWQSLSSVVNRWFVCSNGDASLLESLQISGRAMLHHVQWARGIAIILKGALLAGFLWMVRERRARSECANAWHIYLVELSMKHPFIQEKLLQEL